MISPGLTLASRCTKLTSLLACAHAHEDAGGAAFLRKNGNAAAGIESSSTMELWRRLEHAAHKAQMCNQGRAGAATRAVTTADGDTVENGVGAHAARKHACAKGAPRLVYGQLHQGACSA